MHGQFSHWTNAEIVDRWLDGMRGIDIARRTGRTVMDVMSIIRGGQGSST